MVLKVAWRTTAPPMQLLRYLRDSKELHLGIHTPKGSVLSYWNMRSHKCTVVVSFGGGCWNLDCGFSENHQVTGGLQS